MDQLEPAERWHIADDRAETQTDTHPLLHRFLNVRARTEAITNYLSPEDCQIQSMEDASPTKWHLAHTTWFWETFLLGPHAQGFEVHHPQYDFLFNSYYEAVGPRHARPHRGMITRPTLDEIMVYRAATTEKVANFLKSGKATDPICEGIILTGIAHEEQHQELSFTDIKHAIFQNPLMPSVYPVSPPKASVCQSRPNTYTRFDGGLVDIGFKGKGFHFDNEGPAHQSWLTPFELANALITNGDVLNFIADGGYETSVLWLSDGWAWINSAKPCAPLYWFQQDDEWWHFTLHGIEKVDPAAPATHINFYEADAIASWTGARLPTEAEWEFAAASQAANDSNPASPRYRRANETCHPRASRSDGICDLFGEVWQWTRSDYAPYPGYRAPAGAIGEYNGKFMSNQYVLRGSSCATSPGHARLTYRNFFPAGASWQFSGLRLAKDV